MKTKAEIINETLAYIAENGRALNEEGSCRYRMENGKCCAVGRCLRPDYDTRGIEHEPANAIPDIEIALQEQYRGHDIEFWGELQYIHDNYPYWKYESDKYSKAWLNDYGVDKVKTMCDRFNINFSDIIIPKKP